MRNTVTAVRVPELVAPAGAQSKQNLLLAEREEGHCRFVEVRFGLSAHEARMRLPEVQCLSFCICCCATQFIEQRVRNVVERSKNLLLFVK